jgi:hypothetical protein
MKEADMATTDDGGPAFPHPEDDPEVARDMVLHEGQSIADRIYELIPAAFAYQFLTDFRDEADRKYRMRSRKNG